jgi:hypothetical protein
MPQARRTGSRSGGAKATPASKTKPAGSAAKRSTAAKPAASTAKRSTAAKSAGTAAKRPAAAKTSTAAKRSTAGASSSRASAASRATSSAKATASAADARLEAAATRLRKLNERIIEAGKEAGETTLSSYEKALKAIARSLESGPGKSEVDWISHLATTQAKFIRDVTNAWTSAARGVLK